MEVCLRIRTRGSPLYHDSIVLFGKPFIGITVSGLLVLHEQHLYVYLFCEANARKNRNSYNQLNPCYSREPPHYPVEWQTRELLS